MNTSKIIALQRAERSLVSRTSTEMKSHCASKVFFKRKMSMDGVIVWRFLFCGIFCWIKREFTSFKVWSWSALPRLAQGTPSASTNALWLVIFGTLRKIFTCNTFLLQNPMARHRQRCLRHTMDFGVRSFSPSILDPFIPSYDFYGSERNIYFLYGHWHYILTSKDREKWIPYQLTNWKM